MSADLEYNSTGTIHVSLRFTGVLITIIVITGLYVA